MGFSFITQRSLAEKKATLISTKASAEESQQLLNFWKDKLEAYSKVNSHFLSTLFRNYPCIMAEFALQKPSLVFMVLQPYISQTTWNSPCFENCAGWKETEETSWHARWDWQTGAPSSDIDITFQYLLIISYWRFLNSANASSDDLNLLFQGDKLRVVY